MNDTPRTDSRLKTAIDYNEGSADPAFLGSLVELCRTLERELAGARTAISDCLPDAERYRWLRDRHNGDDDDWFVYAGKSPGNLDADIDAQMAKEPPK